MRSIVGFEVGVRVAVIGTPVGAKIVGVRVVGAMDTGRTVGLEAGARVAG